MQSSLDPAIMCSVRFHHFSQRKRCCLGYFFRTTDIQIAITHVPFYPSNIGQSCGDDAFKKELSCPLCDTVLPKDGVSVIALKPDAAEIKKVSSKVFGFEPHEMCEVLQIGLKFWANQRQNESLKKAQDIRGWKKRVEESEAQVRKLSTVRTNNPRYHLTTLNTLSAFQSIPGKMGTRVSQQKNSH